MKLAEEISLEGSPVSNANDAAMELARLWLVDGRPTFLINTQLWEKPEMWGLLLSDFVEHIANAYRAEGNDRNAVIKKITMAFEVERKSPTSSADPR